MQQRALTLVGHLEAEVGVGEVARQLVRACDAAEVPVLPVSLEATASRQGHAFGHAEVPVGLGGTVLVCVNADQLPRVAPRLGRRLLRGRRVVGQWWWEVPAFPSWLAESFGLVDEVWAGSAWLRDVLGAAAPEGVEVVHVPVPVTAPAPAAGVGRARLGLPAGRFLFGFAFDHHSLLARKNPLGLIAAYTRAFGPDDGCALVVKSVNGDAHPAAAAAVAAAAADREDVVVLDGYLEATWKDALVATCDCWVSLHRSEGFGITLAEAMALGVPVVATAWSGNAAFTTAQTAWPVRHRLVPIGPGHDPYPAEAEWAEPDLDDAVAQLRRVVAEPAERARRVAAGRAWIAAHHAPAVVGRQIAARLAAHPSDPLPLPAATDLATLLRTRRTPKGSDPFWRSSDPFWRSAGAAEAAKSGRLGADRQMGSDPFWRSGGPRIGRVPQDREELGRVLERERARAARAESLLATARAALDDAERRAAQAQVTALERDEARQAAAELATRNEVLDADKAELAERVARAARVQDDLTASLSWRVTRPLRAAKHLRG